MFQAKINRKEDMARGGPSMSKYLVHCTYTLAKSHLLLWNNRSLDQIDNGTEDEVSLAKGQHANADERNCY